MRCCKIIMGKIEIGRQIAGRDRAVDKAQKKIRPLIGRKSMLEEIDDER